MGTLWAVCGVRVCQPWAVGGGVSAVGGVRCVCQPWAVGGGVSAVGGGRCVCELWVVCGVCVSRPVSCTLTAALRAWNSCNTYMPSRIIVYRDGVGDGQLKTLVSYEVPQFLDCLKSMGRGYR